MGHKHSVRDLGAHFTIDQFTRQIKNDSANKTTIVQFDHNSERLTFELPLYVDGHAMTLCDLIEIHYINISTDGKSQNHGTYEVDDIKTEGEKAIFTWLISQECTQLAGSLNFFIVFKCTENGVTVYRWGTEIYKNLPISEGMDNGETVLTEYPDILAQWKAQLFDASNTAVTNVATAEANALAAIEAAGEAKKQAVLDSIPDEYEALSTLADQNHRNKAGAIVVEEEGESIVVNDASEYPLQNLKLFGKSTQDGTPTPDAPVDIVSVEEPVVTVVGKNLAYSKGSKDVEYEGLHIVITKGLSEVFLHGTTTKSFGYAMMEGAYLAPGVYTMSIYGLNTVSSKYDQAYLLDLATRDTICSEVKSNAPVTFTVTHAGNYRVDFLFAEGTTYDNATIRVQIEAHSEATEYEPYKVPQTAELTYALPGIPVASGGNYTDENGQQWICDEVDLARGVYVQRIGEIVFNENQGYHLNAYRLNYGDYVFGCSMEGIADANTPILSDKLSFKAWENWDMETDGDVICYTGYAFYFFLKDQTIQDSDAFKDYVTANPITAQYILATTIETPLSEAEINAFKALHTNKPNTTILNDAGAHMAVSYVADTKTYIDNKIKEMTEGVTA